MQQEHTECHAQKSQQEAKCGAFDFQEHAGVAFHGAHEQPTGQAG
jgi:hypothetical protein